MKLNEISKQTLAKYIPKAAMDAANLASAAAYELANNWDEEGSAAGEAEDKKAVRRVKGITKATKRLASESLLAGILEVKNHLGEKTYQTFQGWKRACRLVNPQCTFEGDKEVCNAKPGVGEWDGESGCVYLREQEDFDVLAAAEREGTDPDEFADEIEDEQDTITMDIPLMIRMFEVMREEVQSDEQLHDIVERLLAMKNRGTLTMDDYEEIIPVEPNGEGEEW